MSRIVIGHKDGKPIYRDEGPNVARSDPHNPLKIGSEMVPHRTARSEPALRGGSALPRYRIEQ